MQYKSINVDLVAKLWKEYLIYDIIGMIGSVGGTLGIFIELQKNLYVEIKVLFILGMFIGFSLIGFVSWICSYLKRCKRTPFSLPK